MGINPKTGLPIKFDKCTEYNMKPELRKLFRIVDEQNAVNKYKWFNLPSGLNGQLLERILYYKGQGMFFYMEANEKFYFLPYALDGTIDVYGRYTGVTPLPFGGGTSDGEKKPKAWIQGLVKTPEYEVVLPEELDLKKLADSCVLLSDYTNQLSQNIIPRQQLQEPILEFMSDCLPFCRTALLNGTGVSGMRVQSADEQSNVDVASRSVNEAALNGKKWIPVIGQLDFQDLTASNVADSQQFLLTLESLDNLRLSMHGLDNGGIYQKQSQMLEAEHQMNRGNTSLVLQDGLTNRQRFCDIVNSIWGIGIWCDVAEPAVGDVNMDGLIADE